MCPPPTPLLRWLCIVLKLRPRFPGHHHACNIRSESRAKSLPALEPVRTFSREAEFIKALIFIGTPCTLLQLLLLLLLQLLLVLLLLLLLPPPPPPPQRQTQKGKEQRSLIRDCLLSYGGNIPLYSPDALWMLTRGHRVVADNHPVRPTVTTWAPSLALQAQNVFICLHREVHLFSISGDATRSLTDSWTQACKLFYIILLFSFIKFVPMYHVWFFLKKKKDTTQAQLETKVAPDVFKMFVTVSVFHFMFVCLLFF